jgi:hypothetical protein
LGDNGCGIDALRVVAKGAKRNDVGHWSTAILASCGCGCGDANQAEGASFRRKGKDKILTKIPDFSECSRKEL